MEEDEGTQEPFNIEHRRDISSHVKHIDCIQNSRCFSLRENCESMTLMNGNDQLFVLNLNLFWRRSIRLEEKVP